MVSTLNMGGEGFNKGLEVGIDVGGDDGAARVARFVYLMN